MHITFIPCPSSRGEKKKKSFETNESPMILISEITDVKIPPFLSLSNSLMKASHKMVSRCMYLNILLQTKSHDILNR